MAIDDEELASAIRVVLAAAAKGRASEGEAGSFPQYLTAYQILRRLPEPLRQALINEYGEPGKRAGRHFTAVSRVAQVAREIADHDYLDAKELTFEYDEDEKPVDSGTRVVGLYRLRRS